MSYLLVFTEGIITFVSPCILPMLPIYVGYFMAGPAGGGRSRTLLRAAGFVAGFTLMFVLMGAFAGVIGGFFVRYSRAVNIVGGAIIVGLGLIYLGVLNIPLFRGAGGRWQGGGFWASLLMGLVFSVGWTPCVGAFLGSALVLASQSGSLLQGAVMLLLYSLGLGVPFILGALLIDQLKTLLDWLKKHNAAVTRISGGLLIAIGLLMMTGLLGQLTALAQ